MPTLFPSIVASYLNRSRLERPERELLAERLCAGGEDSWRAMDEVALPPLLLPTDDPIVLALRRWVGRDSRRVGARHRVAMELAHRRPFGFLRLALEEAWLLARRPECGDLATRRQPIDEVLDLTHPTLVLRYPLPAVDLRCFGLLARAAVEIGQPGADWERTWERAVAESRVASNDPEIQATALEVGAGGAIHGQSASGPAVAEGWWRLALALYRDAGVPHPDRLAELHAGYATFLFFLKGRREARKHLLAAEQLLAGVDAAWNEPLRVRLANLRQELS
jgi:hypothetical protein